ncbi:MAG: carbamoyltransferase HypF [Verrucomicrobiales bacterium]
MPVERVKAALRGAVQGVGFRPFVYRLANELGLGGWVLNSSQGVFVEAEGERGALDEFIVRLDRDKPPRAVIFSRETTFLRAKGYSDFEIRYSDSAGEKSALILPDIATCGDCLAEVFDPADRRHHYPFTNCTNCGPRFSIVEALPYDRPNTSMKSFEMCGQCHAEYHDPENRRFHAQPNACPDCGPRLRLLDASGAGLGDRHDALSGAARAIREGRIVALKGLGGFHLMVDAGNESAVRRLRERKKREEKPLAVMVPSALVADGLGRVSEREGRLLSSPEAPIVLIERRGDATELAPAVTAGSPLVGLMLPNTPLHHLLLRELGFPVVATSGNLSDEPICIDEAEALTRLGAIADLFLTHDRPIVRHVDDSVARIILGGEQVLRRARGYAPLPVATNLELPCTLAVGAHLKNAVAMSVGSNIFISQHIGDLETPAAHEAFARVCRDFQTLYDAAPDRVACDLHPEYLSTKFAADQPTRLLPVQHHFAHVLSCMTENELEPPVLGVCWDGTGLGDDGTIWGGEFLLARGPSFDRVACFRTFPLPGGDRAVREPRRCALGMMYEIGGDAVFDEPDHPVLRHFAANERKLLRQALARGVNTPATSSAGRLFDGVASLAGLRQEAAFEGQAAMLLEQVAEPAVEESYSWDWQGDSPIVVDWAPAMNAILADLADSVPVGIVAAKFHNALVDAIVEVARRVGEPDIVLTGGCFQNRRLTERSVKKLREEGFVPHWHQRVPPNDGGIALGQIAAVARREAASLPPRERAGTDELLAVG